MENPEINLGTEHVAGRCSVVARSFIHQLSEMPFFWGHLDVRENIRFKGGHLCRHVMRRFGERVCPLAIDVKKFFMDEWSDQVYGERTAALKQAFKQIVPGLLNAMEQQKI